MTMKDRKQLYREEIAKQPLLTEKTENVCSKCHQTNEDGAMFCAECGSGLQMVKCSKCGSTARSRADICEVCGEWLLKGQCKFCYALVDNDEAFCGECGNPAEGITCQRCGKLSIFDFCKTCGIPLSIQAKEMVKETADDPVIKEIASLFEQISNVSEPPVLPETESEQNASESETKSAPQNDEALKLKAYRDSSQKPADAPKTKSVRKSLFSSDQKQSINQLAEEVAQEEERRRIEEERRIQEEERQRREAEERRRLEEERLRQEEERRREHERRIREQLSEAMRKIGSMRFSNGQDARRYFMNIMASLPREIADRIRNRGMVWRCNAYDTNHDSPGDCADPSQGGVWLIR